MADCPGIVHLASMADGGLARVRTPGGELSAVQIRAVADAAERRGSGVVDLTSRANLQIRGLAMDGGPPLAAALEAAGFRFHGEADRRRNILVDPFSGLDRQERRDLRPLAEALDQALVAASWIGALSPKFSFALDGGGASGVGGVPSDVAAIAADGGVEILFGDRSVAVAESDAEALQTLFGIAQATAALGPEARAKDLAGATAVPSSPARPSLPVLRPRFGAVPATTPGLVALSLAVPVGRLDPAMLRFIAEACEREGDGRVRLAPWSGVVLAGVAAGRGQPLLAAAEAAGFTPVEIAQRLSVVACAGALSCERAREPAKALAADVLALAAAEPERLPERPVSLHLSACPKGCAGSAPADLLLLGASERAGWGLHPGGRPRRPGPESGRIERPDAAAVLSLLKARA